MKCSKKLSVYFVDAIDAFAIVLCKHRHIFPYGKFTENEKNYEKNYNKIDKNTEK